MSDLDDLKLQEQTALLIRVRALCQIYSSSAEIIGGDTFSDDQGISEYEKQRYEDGRKEVLEIAIKLTDEFCRDSALQASLDFCMKARDLQFATMVAKAITTKTIQEKVVKDHGSYFALNEQDGRLVPTPAAAIDPSPK
jgi:hypothetical protein